MLQLVIPTSASAQGKAFEDLILSYYQRSETYSLREWSTYLHGHSGQWWQCDGIVEDEQNRYLIEAKFFRDRLASVKDIDPARRQNAALDTDCTAIRYISLNGFTADMLNWTHDPRLKVEFTTWAELRNAVTEGFSGYTSTLLDEFAFTGTSATSFRSTGELHFSAVKPEPLSQQYPEFVAVPDSLELWLRRLPHLAVYREQMGQGTFCFDDGTGSVRLVPDRVGDLSLQDAWEIEDAFSGYAGRTYSAVRATAKVLSDLGGGFLRDVQQQLHGTGWTTGLDGVRNSLDFLVQLGLAVKELRGRFAYYQLTAPGQTYTSGGPDDSFFAQVLNTWPPYRAMRLAIKSEKATPIVDGQISYFRAQYAPYAPYAKSLFNPNKTEGLLRLYKIFDA